eukprot:GFKZ01015191.1.p1 GENE.GFKZ01015191.1~~GFKZ01015191.1.p1  ORF type:complete len:206 (-),score=18.62 GFKZ01015191.1:364-981(-)
MRDSAFCSTTSLTTFLPLYQPAWMYPAPQPPVHYRHRLARTSTPKRPPLPTIHPTISCLHPPNAEADWVIVDVSLKGLTEPPTSTFLLELEDDAKSLVRNLLRDNSAELSVTLASDEAMQQINCEWRGVDDSTDVLSFPQNDPDGVILGDVVISIETAQRQIRDRGEGYDLRDEVRVLIVHGVLHLLGYDHEGKIEGDWLVVSDC